MQSAPDVRVADRRLVLPTDPAPRVGVAAHSPRRQLELGASAVGVRHLLGETVKRKEILAALSRMAGSSYDGTVEDALYDFERRFWVLHKEPMQKTILVMAKNERVRAKSEAASPRHRDGQKTVGLKP